MLTISHIKSLNPSHSKQQFLNHSLKSATLKSTGWIQYGSPMLLFHLYWYFFFLFFSVSCNKQHSGVGRDPNSITVGTKDPVSMLQISLGSTLEYLQSHEVNARSHLQVQNSLKGIQLVHFEIQTKPLQLGKISICTQNTLLIRSKM